MGVATGGIERSPHARRWIGTIGLAALGALLLFANASVVRAADDLTLAGGSDFAAGSSVEMPQGSKIPPIHYIYLVNETDRPIPVVWQAFTPRGIELTPEATSFTLGVGETRTTRFTVSTDNQIAPGTHPVTAQFARTDVPPNKNGEITQVPAIATEFNVIVSGDSGVIEARAVSKQDGTPVLGDLTLYAVDAGPSFFAIAETNGSFLSERVAPGNYEARFSLGSTILATGQAKVANRRTEKITLAVDTLFFNSAGADPRIIDGEVVAAELSAGFDNQYRPIPGPVKLVANVTRDDQLIETFLIEKWKRLEKGTEEPTNTYIPSDGWSAGTYRFSFEIQTPGFTVEAVDDPEIVIPGPPYLLYLALALLAVLLILLFWWARVRWRQHKL